MLLRVKKQLFTPKFVA